MEKVILAIVIVLAIGSIIGYRFAKDVQAIATGMVSQTICTNVIMIGRELDDVIAHDLSKIQRDMTTSTVDKNNNTVTTEMNIGPISHINHSVYHTGLGCTMLHNANIDELKQESYATVEISGDAPNWPKVTNDKEGIDYGALSNAIEIAFAETETDTDLMKNTRAVLVWHKSALLAEKFAEGFDGNTPMRAMSMTKSVSAAVIGVIANQGKLDLQASPVFPEWSDASDPRSQLNLNHMLQMTSGHEYKEEMESDPTNILNMMMFGREDQSGFAIKQEIDKEPGSYWDYQTVNSVLLQRAARNAAGSKQAYHDLVNKDLFDKADMTNSFMQADTTGTYTGGALMYASPRDWMRFGLLYLHDGVALNGNQLFAKGWAKYTNTPSDASLQRRAYGAQFWLNAKAKKPFMPSLPEDLYAAQGHYGQYVVIVPSLDLVVVRLGMTLPPQRFDLEGLVKGVVDAIQLQPPL